MTIDWIICVAIAISLTVGFFVGSQRERRRWTRTVRHLLPGSSTVMIDDAMGMENGDIIVAFDSRTGKPRRRE